MTAAAAALCSMFTAASFRELRFAHLLCSRKRVKGAFKQKCGGGRLSSRASQGFAVSGVIFAGPDPPAAVRKPGAWADR